MGISPLYKKYGAGIDPGMALVESQKAVGQGFKEALAGVDKLLQQAEQGYVEKNTGNLQEYLKANVKNAGLGADAPDLIDIKQKFGKLVNMETLDKTVTDVRGKMVNEALDDATGVAGQTFGQTEDMAQAGNALKQRLLSLGMRETDANKHMATWRQNNQFLAEDVKIHEARMVDEYATNVLANARSGSGFEPEMVIRETAGSLPDKVRDKAILKARDLADQLSKFTPDQQAEITTINQRIDLQNQAEIDQINTELQQKKDLLKQMGGVPESALATVDKLETTLGGVPKAIREDATPGFWRGVGQHIRDWFPGHGLSGEELSQHIQSQTEALVDEYKLDTKTALGIAVSAYNTQGGGPTEKSPNAINARMHMLAGEELKKKAALEQVMKFEQAGILRKNEILDASAQVKQELFSGARIGNLTGREFNIPKEFENNFRNKLVGGKKTPDEAKPTTGQPGGVNVGGYDISRYATDPNHEQAVQKIYANTPAFNNSQQIDFYIRQTNPDSPLTGDMVIKAAQKHGTDPRILVAIMQQDSSLGTAGKGARTMNPGNVGNDDTGKEVTFSSWQEGVDATAEWLSRHKATGTTAGAPTTKSPAQISAEAILNKAGQNANIGTSSPAPGEATAPAPVAAPVPTAATGAAALKNLVKTDSAPSVDPLTGTTTYGPEGLVDAGGRAAGFVARGLNQIGQPGADAVRASWNAGAAIRDGAVSLVQDFGEWGRNGGFNANNKNQDTAANKFVGQLLTKAEKSDPTALAQLDSVDPTDATKEVRQLLEKAQAGKTLTKAEKEKVTKVITKNLISTLKPKAS